MREAKLVGLSPDGKYVILAMLETSEEIAVPVDDRFRAALRGDRARLGQLEIQMESALRPRDIQARIRSGESPESVAQFAQMPVERVMAFAGPVLAERDHVATLAQRASVRRRGGEGPARNLGTWVAERLRTRQVDPESAEWDAWRREDGRWAVKVAYRSGDNDCEAMFAYDAPGRYAVPDDEEARWLVGEQPRTATTPAPATPPAPTGRRLTAVEPDLDIAPDHGADSYEAGFDQAISITRERSPEPVREPREQVRPVQAVPDPEPWLDPGSPGRFEPARPEQPSRPEPVRREPAARQEPPAPAEPVAEEPTVPIDVAAPQPEEQAPAEEAPPADAGRKKSGRRGKRASVPSWDEIMFGKKAD